MTFGFDGGSIAAVIFSIIITLIYFAIIAFIVVFIVKAVKYFVRQEKLLKEIDNKLSQIVEHNKTQ
jgi:TM2 domain-containing membrane protein YozV